METRANFVVIGLFALAVIVTAGAFIYWAAEFGGEEQQAEVIFQFNGPVNGLGIGSPVLFNGIQVGAVRSLALNNANPEEALALALVDLNAPLRSDTQASLGITGITGTAFIGLRGGSVDEPPLLDPDNPVIIQARASDVQDLVDGARTILERADTAMETIEGFLVANEPVLSETIADINTITSAVADQSDSIEQLMLGVSSIADEISGLSGRLEGIISGAEGLLVAVEPESVSEILENVRVASTEFRGIGEDARAIVARGDEVFDTLQSSADTLASTLEDVQSVVGEVDPLAVRQVVGDVTAFTESLPGAGERVTAVLDQAEVATANITRFTEALDSNAEAIDSIFADAAIIAGRLETASARIDGLMNQVEGLLGDDETQGLIGDAREAAQALRNIAVSFESRSDTIASGLARFSTRGLQDAEALIADGRRMLARIDRVVASLERNPQQLLFGDGTAPEYTPQRR